MGSARAERPRADLGLLADRRAADESPRGRGPIRASDERSRENATPPFRVRNGPSIAIWNDECRRILRGLGPRGFIAGGAARELIMGNDAPPAEDIDVFCFGPGDEQTIFAALKAEFGAAEISENAATFAGELPIQVIKAKRYGATATYGHPIDVLGHFSFTTEQFAVLDGGATYIGQWAEQDTRERRLIVNNVTDPIEVAGRALKYAAKGYTMAPEQLHAIFDDWDARPPEYRELIGAALRTARRVANGFRR